MNNDKLKFRVWNTREKQYLNTTDLYIDSNGALCTQMLFCGKNQIFRDVDNNYNIIEQSTGLKDCDGKLIYEGDILQTPSNTYFVRHDEKTCGFVCEYHLDDRMGLLLHSDLTFKKYRIVGNIHENPELIDW